MGYARPASEAEYVNSELGPAMTALRQNGSVLQDFLVYAAKRLGTTEAKISGRLRQAFTGRPLTTPIALALLRFIASGGHRGVEEHTIYGTKVKCPPGMLEEIEAFIESHPGRDRVVRWEVDNPRFSPVAGISAFIHAPTCHPEYLSERQGTGEIASSWGSIGALQRSIRKFKSWPDEFHDRKGERWYVHYLVDGDDDDTCEVARDEDAPCYLSEAIELLEHVWRSSPPVYRMDDFCYRFLLDEEENKKMRNERKRDRIHPLHGADRWLTLERIRHAICGVAENAKDLSPAVAREFAEVLHRIGAAFPSLRDRLTQDVIYVDEVAIELMPPALQFEYQRVHLVAAEASRGFFHKYEKVLGQLYRAAIADMPNREIYEWDWILPAETCAFNRVDLRDFLQRSEGESSVALFNEIIALAESAKTEGVVLENSHFTYQHLKKLVAAKIKDLAEREGFEARKTVYLPSRVHLCLQQVIRAELELGSTDYGTLCVGDEHTLRLAFDVKYSSDTVPGKPGWSRIHRSLLCFLLAKKRTRVD